MAVEFRWTVSIIAQEDADNGWEYEELIESIENQAVNAQIRYIIFHYFQSSRRAQVETAVVTNNGHQKVRKVIGSDKQDISLVDVQTLVDFFESHVLDKESMHHMLITWGHGAGLGFFHFREDSINSNNFLHEISGSHALFGEKSIPANDFLEYSHLLRANLSIRKESFTPGLKSFFSAFLEGSHAETANVLDHRNDLITAEQLAGVFEKTFRAKGKVVNVFIANNCYMQMFEVGYALRKHVESYVAAQTSIPFAGINFSRLFTMISTIDSVDMKALAGNITDTFLIKYVDEPFASTFIKKRPDFKVRDIAISAISLKNYDEVFTIIDETAKFLLEKLNDPQKMPFYVKIIERARRFCSDFTQLLGFIDFSNFFTELIKAHQGENPGILLDLYISLIDLKDDGGVLLSQLSPGKLFLFTRENCSLSPHMFSVFFPPFNGPSTALNDFYDSFVENPDSDSEFFQKSAWVSFIKRIRELQSS